MPWKISYQKLWGSKVFWWRHHKPSQAKLKKLIILEPVDQIDDLFIYGSISELGALSDGAAQTTTKASKHTKYCKIDFEIFKANLCTILTSEIIFNDQSFPYFILQCQQLIMLAGGTGITPMIQFTDQILSNEESETRILLCYSVHNVDEIIQKERFDEWKGFWNFKIHYFLTVSLLFILYHEAFGGNLIVEFWLRPISPFGFNPFFNFQFSLN